MRWNGSGSSAGFNQSIEYVKPFGTIALLGNPNKNTEIQLIRAAKKGAVIVFVGYSATGEMTLPIGMALDKELTFKTVFRYRNIYPMAIEAVAGGKIRIKDIVTDYFELDDIKNALDSCVHNKADIVKGVIKVC